jgi:hemoglobin
VEEHEIYPIVGEKGLRQLVAAFYRQVAVDDVLGPMYPIEDLQGAEQRLGDFLIYRFGGPPTYIEQRGHPRLRMRHAPFAIGKLARDRWMALMNHALEQSAFPSDVHQLLREFFDSTATFMLNRPD